MGNVVKILGVRQSLIGDCIMSLPVLNLIKKTYPNRHVYWHLAKKCSQASPLFVNHPLINETVITDCEEGFGAQDIKLANECDVVFNTTPEHPLQQNWHNYRSMAEETWVMAGLPLKEYQNLSKEERCPKLHKWFDTENLNKTIAIHCFAGYGRDNHRSPNETWWNTLVGELINLGYDVVRLGHPAEPSLFHHKDYRSMSFFDQVKIALGSSLYIGTDSGFSLVVGSYSHPQVTLLTNWNVGHRDNPNCLEPLNDNNISLFNPFNKGGCTGINIEDVIKSVNSIIK